METPIYVVSPSKTKKFKSYYVVWKPQADYVRVYGHVSFKSYYVVWKPQGFHSFLCARRGLNRTMQYGNISYHDVSPASTQSLNRTMQYGNSFGERLWGRRKSLFKSYYVVWKQFSVPIKYTRDRLFKSYYVVWKLFSISIIFFPASGLNRTMQYGNFNVPEVFYTLAEV